MWRGHGASPCPSQPLLVGSSAASQMRGARTAIHPSSSRRALMAAPAATSNRGTTTDHRSVRRATETKASFKTTELIFYVLAVVGVLIAAQVVDESNAGGFGAKQAWLYVTILTVGYMISRGLAKS